MKTMLIDQIDPRLGAQVRAQAIERGARVSAKPKATTKPTTSKPKPKRIAPANVSRVESHVASTATSMSDFSHLLRARALEPPPSSSGTRRPAPMSHEQAVQTAAAIVRAHNKARGIVTDADEARARAQAEAAMTPTAKRIVEVARRVGLA